MEPSKMNELIKTKIKDQVEYSVTRFEEEGLIEDHLEFAEDVAEVAMQLAAGNEWAWCHIQVTAKLVIDGMGYFGDDGLGACSYKSEADFKTDGYYRDMQAVALDNLCDSLRHKIEDGLKLQEKFGIK